MTDEQFIRETLPLIRDTYSKYKSMIVGTGFEARLLSRGPREHLGFYLTLKRMDETSDPEVEAIAKEARRT